MSTRDPAAIETHCWCGAIWWQDHRHFSVAPVAFGRSPTPSPLERLGWILFLVCAASCIFFATGCATVKTCAQPLTSQATQDGAAVLVCAAGGTSLATCEENQLSVEAGQLTQDVLICAESAIAVAANGTHTAAK